MERGGANIRCYATQVFTGAGAARKEERMGWVQWPVPPRKCHSRFWPHKRAFRTGIETGSVGSGAEPGRGCRRRAPAAAPGRSRSVPGRPGSGGGAQGGKRLRRPPAAGPGTPNARLLRPSSSSAGSPYLLSPTGGFLQPRPPPLVRTAPTPALPVPRAQEPLHGGAG